MQWNHVISRMNFQCFLEFSFTYLIGRKKRNQFQIDTSIFKSDRTNFSSSMFKKKKLLTVSNSITGLLRFSNVWVHSLTLSYMHISWVLRRHTFECRRWNSARHACVCDEFAGMHVYWLDDLACHTCHTFQCSRFNTYDGHVRCRRMFRAYFNQFSIFNGRPINLLIPNINAKSHSRSKFHAYYPI